ncbi:hypothetical protein RUM43_006888 [Polyplax serrata]|uniref:Uncharacterized protein n=1 Tax=Polyplax serrata TaxID=468196 RepID=A0AAN8PBU4_POLSC
MVENARGQLKNCKRKRLLRLLEQKGCECKMKIKKKMKEEKGKKKLRDDDMNDGQRLMEASDVRAHWCGSY